LALFPLILEAALGLLVATGLVAGLAADDELLSLLSLSLSDEDSCFFAFFF